ncbi:unnamed protein product [Paramecium primaurelia]|uniref:Uncharacterized protein n=1 Tax=Paramecium primaurelia TaxID=5886 RepID=A0A8S1L1R0_PARPR|nr:unnamed protein product [Paramecium primaurelia]
MYYAPSRPIEIEKFPKGYIKPFGQNLEFLQRPPVDNRKIQDYYGKAQDLPVQQERSQNKDRIYTQGSSEQPQQLQQEKQQDDKQKENQNQKVGSNIDPQRMISPERYQSAPYTNTIHTGDNIYKPLRVHQNFTQSILQPLESRISPSNLREPNLGYVHSFRGFSQDFQEPGLSFVPQDFRCIPSQELGLPLSGYRRMAPPGILSDYRRGIPEPILSRRNCGRDLKRNLSYRVFPATDYRQGPPVDFHRPPPILNERNALPLDYEGYPFFDDDRQRFDPALQQRMYFDPLAVPTPDYYVPEYRGFPPIGIQRDLNERIHFNQRLPYQNELYPPSYGRIDQQIFREGRQDYYSGNIYQPYGEQRTNELNRRIQQV